MSTNTHADVVDVRAVSPDADLACDVTIATGLARSGLREDLARGIVRPVRELEDGVEVTFQPAAWEAVRRYIELESRCCPFLDLSARRTPDAVILTVSGRAEARGVITAIFAEH